LIPVDAVLIIIIVAMHIDANFRGIYTFSLQVIQLRQQGYFESFFTGFLETIPLPLFAVIGVLVLELAVRLFFVTIFAIDYAPVCHHE